MTTLSNVTVLGILLMLSLPPAAQERATVVKLAVKHDGKAEPTPDHVTISFAGHSVQIPLRDGRFEVPQEFVSAQKVTLALDVERDHVSIPDLAGTRFTAGDWTLLLAERRYDKSYQWAVPKGAIVRQSCILVFESPEADPGTFTFYSGCRSKHK
jgi:hypothetical protein